jgi:hypothetical protein
MKGSQESLTTVVVKDAANWPTPDASNHRDGEVLRKDNNLEQGGFHGVSLHHAMTKYGQAAPANPSTDGSRQGWWPTPEASQGGRQSGSFNQTSWKNADGTPKQPSLAQAAIKELWPTSTDGSRQGWWTPQVQDSKHSGTNPTANGKRDLLVNQVNWATPQLQDGHNINQDSTTHKTIPAQLTKMNMTGKLNPRWVETLMGLPIGWTMPSCKSPVTIEQTNCASSATESCLPQPSELFAF